MGFPVEMFPVLFAIPRTAGWIAQWEEMLLDPEQKIARPRQIYTGADAARLRADGTSTTDDATAEPRVRRSAAGAASAALRARRWSSVMRRTAGSTFDSNRAWEHLRQMVAIGPRPAGSPAIEQTRRYIKDQLAAAGVTVAEQAWDDETPLGKVHMVNSIATIPGRAQGPPRHRRPLRHEAVSRSSGSSARATAGRARRSCSSWRAC